MSPRLNSLLSFFVGAVMAIVAMVALGPRTHRVPVAQFIATLETEADAARDAELRGLVAPVLYDIADRLAEVECPVAPITNARVAAYVDSLNRRP
jgi:hypothetical protein